MTYFEKEENLVEMLQYVPYCQTLLLPNRIKDRKVFSKIHNQQKWKTHWINSSAKNALPPDFYSDKYKLMLEVMRVDDHGYKKNGKYRNPTYERERELENNIRGCVSDERGYISSDIFIVANTGLPSEEDHNYNFYLENFKRVIEKHRKKIAKYKQNHPGYKVLFYVFDESSAYFLAKDKTAKTPKPGEIVLGEHHLYWRDKAFLSAFMETEIDYVIWYTPFKMIATVEPCIELPKVCFFYCKKQIEKNIEYDIERMVSVEA